MTEEDEEFQRIEREAAMKIKPEEFGDTSAAYMVGVQDGKKQREWVGLTDEEIGDLMDAVDHYNFQKDLIFYTQAKLKEKNT